MKQKKSIKKCFKFDVCSINVCPLDLDAGLRKNLPEENVCPFCLKKKSSYQKGMKTLASDNVLGFVPESNLKMLNRRSQKRWQGLHR